MNCRECGTENRQEARFCSMCGSRLENDGSDRSAHASPRSTRKRYVAIGTILVVAIGVYAFMDQLLRTYHPVIEDQPTVAMTSVYEDEQIHSTPVQASMKDGMIALPLKLVLEHRIVRFSDPQGIQPVPILAYVTPQGKLVTAMSKSENCGSTDFFLKGNNIHCASCPSYWNMSSMEAYACCPRYYPDPIPSTVVNDEIRIPTANVRNWQSRL